MIVGCAAIATAAEPQVAGTAAAAAPEPQLPDEAAGPWDEACDAAALEPQVGAEAPGCENVTGRAEIARGFVNGMTLFAWVGLAAAGSGAGAADVADILGAGADTADIWGAGERPFVGAGGAMRGFGVTACAAETIGLTDGEPGRESFGSLGARRASTDVTSPISWGRGIRGTCAMLGRDFRCCMKSRCTVQDDNQHEERVIAVQLLDLNGCARFGLGTTHTDMGRTYIVRT
jgi:hypothetical protein